MKDDPVVALTASFGPILKTAFPNEHARTRFDVANALAEEAARALSAEVEALRKDRERLNFLDRCNQRLNAHYGSDYGWELILNHNINRLLLGYGAVDLNDACGGDKKLPSCRAAIDKEMERIALFNKEPARPDAISSAIGGG